MQVVKLEGRPLKGSGLERLKKFLASEGVRYEDGVEYTICLLDESYRVIGTASAEKDVIKCIAVRGADRSHLYGLLLSNVMKYQFERGRARLRLQARPEEEEIVKELGFDSICSPE